VRVTSSMAACKHQRTAGPALRPDQSRSTGLFPFSGAAAGSAGCSATGERTRHGTPAAIGQAKHRDQQGGPQALAWKGSAWKGG